MELNYLIGSLLMLILGIQIPVITFLYLRLKDLVDKYNVLLSSEKVNQDRINLLTDELANINNAVQSANVEELGIVNSKMDGLNLQVSQAVKGNESLATQLNSLREDMKSHTQSVKNQFQVLLGGGESGKNYT